jgi:hypothetical protein
MYKNRNVITDLTHSYMNSELCTVTSRLYGSLLKISVDIQMQGFQHSYFISQSVNL